MMVQSFEVPWIAASEKWPLPLVASSTIGILVLDKRDCARQTDYRCLCEYGLMQWDQGMLIIQRRSPSLIQAP